MPHDYSTGSNRRTKAAGRPRKSGLEAQMKRALSPRLGAGIMTLTRRVSGALVSRSCQRRSAVTAPHVWWLCGAVTFALVISFKVSAQQGGGGASVAIDADDIGGVVTSTKGAEAGVWVVAETTDLPTKFAKMVVTDDQGRYVLPDLPQANYQVFVRGYGLVDSPRVRSAPGQHLNLTAMPATSAAAAAEYYPGV